MIDKKELANISLFHGLPEEILERIALQADLHEYDEGTTLFYQNSELADFYMLDAGEVVLKSISPRGEVLTMDKLVSGACFGFSSFMGESRSSFTAVCGASPCRIITVAGEKILTMCESDGNLGFAFMLKVVKLFKSRMDIHTWQFLNSIANHPEIRKL